MIHSDYRTLENRKFETGQNKSSMVLLPKSNLWVHFSFFNLILGLFLIDDTMVNIFVQMGYNFKKCIPWINSQYLCLLCFILICMVFYFTYHLF